MTPAFYIDGISHIWKGFYDGSVDVDPVDVELGVRPVINLNANIKMYGSGTMSDPYRLTKEL